jgi:hypothetical protein
LVAFVWVLGLVFAAGASAIVPTDASYFWQGAAGAAVGLLLIPIVRASARHRLLQFLGSAVAVALVLTGTILVLGASRLLGEHAPRWIVPTATAPFIALFAWIAITSYDSRGRAGLGAAVLAFGVLNALAVPIGILIWIDPYTHTNANAPIDFLIELVVLSAAPGWMVAVSLHFWRAATPVGGE